MEIIRFENQTARGQALAEQIKEDVCKLYRQKDMVTLAVSGGDTSRAFLTALAQQPLDWSRVIIMLADERIVPTNHEDSCSAFIQETLLQHEAKQAVFWSYFDEESIDNEDALQQYANKRFAQPDIVVLGMGVDGHTASIFAQSPQFETLITAPAGILVVDPKTAPHKRLSLTLSALLATQQIYVEVDGSEKNALLAKAKQGKDPQWPISYILDQSNIPVHVYTA